MQLAALVAAAGAVLSEARSLHQGALRGAVLDPSPSRAHSPRWGKPSCPCIGISGVDGEFWVNIMNGSSDNYVTAVAPYPADVGSFCSTWDDGQDPIHCQEGQNPGKGNDWCVQPWCFVDACNCDEVDVPPKVSSMLPHVVYEGRILYYSYNTCGGEDRWTVDHNAKACVLAKDEDECMEKADGNCIWGETTWGTKCLGWEAGGLCTDLPKQSEWGDHDCPCIGFGDVNGSIHIKVDGKTIDYPGDLGSTCRAWHMDHLPECVGDNKAESCGEPWCFVDIDRCTSVTPRPSKYLPDAMWNGHKLYYSYETCGGKAPAEETTTTTTSTTAAPTTATPAAAEEPTEEEEKEEAEDEKEEKEEKEEEHDEAEDEDPEDDDDEADEKEEEMAENDEQKLDTEEKALDKAMGTPSGMGVDYDDKAYSEEWHEEWRHGSIPAFRDLYPEAKKFEDRQSDGKASKVPSGLR